MYSLDNRFTVAPFTVTVIGCGGTGGFVAESLCRLLPHNAKICLVDHDRVEEANLIRQNFSRDELDQFKSEVLATRLATRYRRPVAFSILPISLLNVSVPGLLIGCVDNGPARRDIAQKVEHSFSWEYGFPSWWIDAGNGEYYGQVLIGNGFDAEFDPNRKHWRALPMPTLQMPELLSQVSSVVARDCVQIDQDQGPTINQAMAAIVVEVVRRIIEGSCVWMQLYLDLQAGTLVPVLADTETVSRIMGYRKRRKKGGEK